MALERPHIGRVTAQQVVYVHVVTPRAEMGPSIHAALDEIGAALKAQDVKPSGPWFAHHQRRPTDTFDFDACVPVPHPVELSGRLQAASLPEMEVVRAAYHGPYDGLPVAWPEFVAWIKKKGHAVHNDFFEIYSVGPRETMDQESWQTDLVFPLQQGQAQKERLV